MTSHPSTGPGLLESPRVPVAVVELACTGCQRVYTPAVADFRAGTTGCPHCGGWTWIAQLTTANP
ncbi:MAG: hypothetical protein ACRDQ4_08930 [Pseudonocardiaceae bacterium]